MVPYVFTYTINVISTLFYFGTLSSGADSMGHGGGEEHVPPLLPVAGHGDTVSGRTANKKLTKLVTIMKALSETTNCAFRAKKWRGTRKKSVPHFCFGPVSPTFRFVPGVTVVGIF